MSDRLYDWDPHTKSKKNMEYLDVFKTLERQIFHIFCIFQINSTAFPPHGEEIYPKGNMGSSIFNTAAKMQIEFFG